MSVEAITWALRQPITHSSAKFVLVVLANCASADTGQAFPSIAYLASATGQDRKTVVANLARLQQWGLIEDAGERRGTTRQIIVYRVLCGPDLFPAGEEKRNRSENGTVPKTAGKSPVFPGKSPKNGTRNRQNHQEPSDTHGARASDFEGTFEGHEHPAAAPAPTAAGEIAADLRRRGYRITSQDPGLIAAIEAGVTLAHVLEFAEIYPPGHPKCAGSGAYIVGAAKRQIEQPADSTTGTTGATHVRTRENDADRRARRLRELDEREAAAAQAG